MATVYTREWIQFFTGCGIPDDVAAIYALIFYENRIQKNMLLDLNKEYLRDMGITVMGDVIAILRHAKIIHEKYIRAQILSFDDSVVIEKNNSVNESSPILKKSTPVKRMLEHYTRKYDSQELEPISEVQVTLPNEKVTTLPKLGGEKIRILKPMKKKIQIPSKEKNIKEKELEVPVPKIRRVLPENEGHYKIKMPSGTTERSKKLLELAKKRKAKTVFERLGESSVSSTTSEISTTSSISSNLLNREKNPSVFARLGEKTSMVSSTSSIDDSETVLPDQLPYTGILKKGLHKKNLPNTTMRADEQQQSEVNKVKKGISVKKRLGVTKPEEEAQQKRPVLKAIKRTDVKTAIFKLSAKINSQSGTKVKTTTATINNFKADDSQAKPIGTKTQTEEAKKLTLKRKIDGNSDANPQKKVRFGRTTHRLIPATPSPEDPVSYVKNYPKLTMIISNRANVAENNTLSSGIKIGSLNSDNLNDRLGVKARIGNIPVQGRLGKRMRASAQGVSYSNNKKSTVKDRLG